jgi:nickel-dependent lactate racemase
MSMEYYLHVGPAGRHYFELPSQWTPTHFVQSEEGQTVSPVKDMLLEALAAPLGRSSPGDMILRDKRIAVIIDDITRPTPVREILEVLLPRFTESGASPDNVSIVVACGTHVPMERDALDTRIGSSVAATYRVVQHNAWQDDLVSVEIPGEGRTVKINPFVAGADVKVGISSILPHPMAGYGGGPKILMPGVCDIATIMAHHMKNTVHPKSKSGLTKGNPFHEDCMRTAQAIGLDLSINCVYDRQGQIARIIAGSLEAAFREAVAVCFEKLGVQFREKVDIAITSSHPHSHGIQFYKGLDTPDTITKDDGAILIFAPTSAPIPEQFVNCLRRVKAESGGNASEYVTAIMSTGKPFLPDQSAEFNMAMSVALRRPHIRTILVSPMIPRETASILDLEYAETIEEGVAVLGAAYPKARVAIFPSGGLILPITDWER